MVISQEQAFLSRRPWFPSPFISFFRGSLDTPDGSFPDFHGGFVAGSSPRVSLALDPLFPLRDVRLRSSGPYAVYFPRRDDMAVDLSTADSQETFAGSETLIEEKPSTAPTVERLLSLDAFRGFTMLWIVGGSSLAASLQALGHNSVIDTIVRQLSHSPWQGLHYKDLVWPCFMLMVGASVAFSYAKHSRHADRSQMRLRATRRAVILFLLGSLQASVSSGSPTLIELSSAIQPIAVAYLAAFFLADRSAKVQTAACGLILGGYALLLGFVPAPGVPAGAYQKEANLVLFVDQKLLGRVHPDGWGTVLSTLPTIATTILGLLIGQLLTSSLPQKTKLRVLSVIGICGVLLGIAMDPFVPVIMKIWTTSYGILSAGWASLLFLAFYWTIDVRGFRKWAFPFVVIGMNALAIYMSRTLIPLSQTIGIFTQPIAATLGSFGPLFRECSVLVVEWLILYWMYRRKIFLRA
jgi:predicted acyltransferase